MVADEFAARRLFEEEIKDFPKKDRERLREIFVDEGGLDLTNAVLLLRRLKAEGFISAAKRFAEVEKAVARDTSPKKPEGWVPPEWEGR